MIILVTGWFPTYDAWGIENGKEFVASHGVDEQGNNVIVQNVHPTQMGAVYDANYQEWVIRPPK